MARRDSLIVPSVAALMLALGASASIAAPPAPPGFWSNFYVSLYGGAAGGSGSTDAYGEKSTGLLCSSHNHDPEFCYFDAAGTVGTGSFGGLSFGTTVAPSTRAEVEFSFARLGTTTDTTAWDPEHGTLSYGSNKDSLLATFMFGNIWYDIPLGNQFSAYVGGGAGIAHATGTFAAPITTPVSTDLSLSVNGFTPAVQAGAGLTVAVAPQVTLDFGYRLKSTFGLPVVEAASFDPNLTNVDNSSHMNLGVHVFQVGVNVALN